MAESLEKSPGPAELQQKLIDFSKNYYLIDIWKDKDAYLSLTPQQLKEYFICLSGICICHIMEGNLEKVDQILSELPEDDLLRIGILIVHPKITWKEFIHSINFLKSKKFRMPSVILTAGRPMVLNGFNDFTRLGPFLHKNRELFIEDLSYLYEESVCPAIYNLCVAEYLYQQNKVFDAEILVSKTIKEFDRESERRLLFVALYLQAKILLTHGRLVDSLSYVKNIRKFVKHNGEAEFSYNIDAAEVMAAFHEGNNALITNWLKKKAPDEFADFNMLDLFRYMVKMRAYLVNKKYSAILALAEKLRPLLEAGRRHMDLCELDMILAVTLFNMEKQELAFEAFERCLKIARRRKYYRLIADEGCAVLPLLIAYIKTRGESPFLKMLLEITRSMAIYHPLYLKSVFNSTESFTQREIDMLCLLEQGKSKEDIAEYFFISVNTVKYHLKNIYTKLGANTASQAVWNARVQGVI